MVYSMKRLQIAKIVSVSLIIFLMACTSDQHDKNQANRNEEYLKAPLLHSLTNPIGIILPLQNHDYEIPAIPSNDAVDKVQDIRPPTLMLLNASRSEYSNNRAVIQLENNNQNHDLWSQVSAVINSKGYPIVSRRDTQQSLNTDWITWTSTNQDQQYSGRYQINLVTQDYQTSLQVTSLDLKQRGESVTNPALIQLYTVEMLDSITSGLQQIDNVHTDCIVQGLN